MKNCPRILVVDDELMILNLLERTLKPSGYDVILASDGVSALKLLDQHSPDLVILDIMMPGLNGFQVLRLMRQRSSVPVIMLTAKREAETVRDALNVGADDYVRKPFGREELLARIRAKLRRAQPEVIMPIEGA
jgi:DNA-binding response OmpR family regulator